jgi:hypothetical protein
VIKRVFGHSLVIFLVGISPLVAADSAATVTEAVNQVTCGSSQAADTTPAKVGTHLADGEYLKTGVKSRAELQLADQTITRLGANTIFNYSLANNQIDLEAGTILFSKPKDGKQMNIKAASVTAAIQGTTGFAQTKNKAYLIGLIEGHATLTDGGTDYHLDAGQILRFSPGGKPQLFYFNIPLFLKTSPLITKYHTPLANQAYIDKEVAKYDEFAARGFIQPPTEPFFLSDVDGSVPLIPVPATDSAANALNQFNKPPQPPPPSSNGG